MTPFDAPIGSVWHLDCDFAPITFIILGHKNKNCRSCFIFEEHIRHVNYFARDSLMAVKSTRIV